MSEKMRLRNTKQCNVGIITPEKQFGQNIPPKSFTMVTQDEIDYLIGTCTLLQRGILVVEGEKKEEVLESLGVDKANNANFMSDEDIKKKLSMNANQLKKWLDTVEAEPDTLDKIAQIASGMNLAMNKIQLLKDKIPNFEFIK
jgi:hypothetical protein